LMNSIDNKAYAAGKGKGPGKKNGPITDDADRISYSYADDQPKRTVGEKLREMVSVKDFGAKGDGKTDDTSAFRAAMDSANNIGVPVGHRYLVSNLEIKDDIMISGQGILKKASDAESVLHITGKNVVINGAQFKSTDDKGQPSTEIKLGDGSQNIRITGCT